MDTGGTFTDAFFSNGLVTERAKVETTPHDLTVCFMNCLQEGAAKLGFSDFKEFLRNTDTIKFSSTVGSNTLIQKNGPKIGLIVTKGYEATLYRGDDKKPTILDYVVESRMVKGIREVVSPDGTIIESPNQAEVRDVVESLLENGARIIVVSLKNAFTNALN